MSECVIVSECACVCVCVCVCVHPYLFVCIEVCVLYDCSVHVCMYM